jgi:uncharacterized protein
MGNAMKYHMRKSEQEIKDRSVVEEILRQGQYATLALCRNDEPYVVTLSYGYDPAGRALYFHCAKEGVKTTFIRENPNACATVIADNGYVQSECTHRYQSVVIRGRIDILEDVLAKRTALDILIGHLEQQPETMRSKLANNQGPLDSMNVWRLNIEEVVGKEGT